MRKKRFAGALALCVLLCLLAPTALAREQLYLGNAVIDANRSTKVHLREEPSSKSKSLGLYFTGTPVECEPETHGKWVKVSIGREKGYIHSDYLKFGAEADRVSPVYWTGRTNAKNYARVRKGDSTEHKMVCQVRPDDEILILGETDANWYYVKVKGEYGFISAKLVDVTGETTVPPKQSGGVQNTGNAKGWKAAYLSYLLAEDSAGIDVCGLIEVNGDDVPELAIDTGVEAGGCQILTCHNGQVDVLQTHRRMFTYLPGENLLCNSDGLMDGYYDLIYTIADGKWVQMAMGQYEGFTGEWDEKYGRYICRTYRWNGQEVTRSTYMYLLLETYDLARSVQPALTHSYAQMIQTLSR